MTMPSLPRQLRAVLLVTVLAAMQTPAPAAAADVTAPVTRPPVAVPPLENKVSATVPFLVTWPAATEAESGIARYELRQSVDGGTWASVALATATSTRASLFLLPPHDYRFAVRAIDGAGNAGAWAYSRAVRVRLLTEATGALQLSSGWARRTWSGYLGGWGLRSTTAGATAKLTFVGSQIAWIANRGPGLGAADVFVDGRFVRRVDLYAATTVARRMVFRQSWATAASHTLTVRVAGTAGRPSVDIDGFVLVDPPDRYPTMVGAGDISLCTSTADSATAALLDAIPGRVFVTGDAAYEHGTAWEFSNCYGPTWGRWRLRTSPVPGDHEYDSSGALPYFAYFGERAGKPGEGYYAYDLGAWRIYNLNSNCTQVACARGSKQETWLRADLAANPRRCVAAVWHSPRFSSGLHGNNATVAPFWEALQQAGAEVVLNGDDHVYERFAPQTPSGAASAAGIRQFTIGTGGGPLRPFATIRPNSEKRSSSTHGVLALTLGTSTYAWRFVPVAGGTFRDAGTGTCH